MTIKTTNPLCFVEFHTENRVYSTQFSSNNPSNDLMSVTTNKSLSAPAGTFSITLKGHDWYYRLKPNDMVVISMGNPPEKLVTQMVGLIDTVSKHRKIGQNGGIDKTTTIVGRDFGKVFLKAFIKWFPQFDENEFPIEELGGMGAFLKMLQFFTKESYQISSPAIFIRNVITDILASLINFELKYNNTTVTLKELIRFRLGKSSNILEFVTSMSDFEGALWNALESIQNKPFYELFIDTRTDYMEVVKNNQIETDSYMWGNFSATFGEDDAKIVVFFRPTPFDRDDWDNLTTFRITDLEIIQEDLERSDNENYNVFLAKPAINLFGDVPYDTMVKPIFNEENIKKFGISYLDPQVVGIFSETGNITDSIINIGQKLTKKLADWYKNNVNYESGTMRLKGNGNLKIGTRLHNKDTDMVYYVEGVTQQFNMFGKWVTTVRVTRGQNIKGKVFDYYIGSKIKTYETTSNKTVTETETAFVESEAKAVYYIVKPGDTLYKIASKFYGDGSLYTKIADANPQIKNVNLIYPGQKFKIPMD